MTLQEVASKVDSLVLDTTVRERFTNHIDRFCKMVEDCGQAIKPYSDKLEKAKELTPEQREKYKRSDGEIWLNDICPWPKDWIKANDNDYGYYSYLNIPDSLISRRPPEPENPVLWIKLRGGCVCKPTEKEKLMCHYVLLAIIHDYEYRWTGSSTDTPIFSDKYDGKWFRRDEFIKETWMYYTNFGPIYQGGVTKANDKLSQLNLAFEHVQADIEPHSGKMRNRPPKRKTPPDGEWSNPMSKNKMMKALGMPSYKKFNAFAKQHGIKMAGNRQTFQIRLDGMDITTRKKLEKA